MEEQLQWWLLFFAFGGEKWPRESLPTNAFARLPKSAINRLVAIPKTAGNL